MGGVGGETTGVDSVGVEGGGLDDSIAKSAAVAFAKAATSLSSSTVMAKGVPQGMSEVPAGTRILAKYASSCASKSMVALSVSILGLRNKQRGQCQKERRQQGRTRTHRSKE